MTDASLIQFTVDTETSVPIFQQIYEELRNRITSGMLPAKSRIPSSRAFALELGVSRSSIVAAYDQLIAEGYVESRPGSGIYVSELPDLKIAVKPESKTLSYSYKSEPDFEITPFYPGMPDMRLFPFIKWARCVSRVARDYPQDIITVRSHFGDTRLRQAIAKHLLEWRGIDTQPDQIIITAGAIGGMELVMQVMTKKTDLIALENPGYITFRKMVLSAGHQPIWLDVDDQGARLPDRRSNTGPALTILTPSHQYPLGGAMPTARRTAFLNYASKNKCWIIEDDFDSEFRYSGKPIQALAGMDKEGRVFYSGSFSKIFSVGLRLGYLVIPRRLINKFSSALAHYSKSPSITSQRALAVFMESGEFHRHIRRMRRIYGIRRRLFLKLLSETENIRFTDYQAGMQIAVFLDEQTNDILLSEKLKSEGIICPPLSGFYSKNNKPGLLLGYCSFTEEEIESGMETFNKQIKMPDS